MVQRMSLPAAVYPGHRVFLSGSRIRKRHEFLTSETGGAVTSLTLIPEHPSGGKVSASKLRSRTSARPLRCTKLRKYLSFVKQDDNTVPQGYDIAQTGKKATRRLGGSPAFCPACPCFCFSISKQETRRNESVTILFPVSPPPSPLGGGRGVSRYWLL